MKKKTTKKDFLTFKLQCKETATRLGLTGWDIDYSHEVIKAGKEEEQEAGCDYDAENRIASLIMNKIVTSKSPTPIKRLAKHEIAHLFLADLENLSGERYVSKKEIDREVERLCTVLEKIL